MPSSLLVLQALPHRTDLIGPATGPDDGAIRVSAGEGRGQVYAVRKWQTMHTPLGALA